jgi:hypothetical protein
METSNEILDFKIGDWVIMKEECLNDSLSSNLNNYLNKKYFGHPQKIKKINNFKDLVPVIFLDSPHSTNRIEKFRLATKKEMRIQQLKETFCKTGE